MKKKNQYIKLCVYTWREVSVMVFIWTWGRDEEDALIVNVSGIKICVGYCCCLQFFFCIILIKILLFMRLMVRPATILHFMQHGQCLYFIYFHFVNSILYNMDPISDAQCFVMLCTYVIIKPKKIKATISIYLQT